MDIVHVVDIAATPDRVYDALTTQRGLAGWWTREARAEPRIGAINEFGFPGKMAFRLKVERLDPARRVAWSSVQGPPDWSGTLVTFDIAPAPSGSTLRFTHGGFASAQGGFGVYSYSWAQFLRSLKLLLETGKGEPVGG
jgi:uncharacterized protein YndB with AHSA1/START domain